MATGAMLKGPAFDMVMTARMGAGNIAQEVMGALWTTTFPRQ